MKVRYAAVVAGLALGLMSGAAKAAYVIDINQVGANVVASGRGSLNISDLTYVSTFSPSPFIDTQDGEIVLGVTAYNIYSYGQNTITPSGNVTNADQATGNSVGIGELVHAIAVPVGYISGSSLGVSTAVFDNKTLAELGLFPGQDTVRFGSGNDIDSFTFIIGSPSTVPLPATAPMFGAGLIALGVAGYGLKRKKAAAA